MEEIRQEIEEEGFLSGGSDEPRPLSERTNTGERMATCSNGNDPSR
jgi:hypothetical protein